MARADRRDRIRREQAPDSLRALRTEINRRDRQDARAQLRRGADVEPRQPRGRAIREAS